MMTLGVVVSDRMEDDVFNSDDISIRNYISSAELTEETLAKAAREHWSIENKPHWKMDGVPQAHSLAAKLPLMVGSTNAQQFY